MKRLKKISFILIVGFFILRGIYYYVKIYKENKEAERREEMCVTLDDEPKINEGL